MNERIQELAVQAKVVSEGTINRQISYNNELKVFAENFAELIIKDCIGIIESYEIPVGNSAAGEMACEWTYDALKEIRSKIKDHFKE